MQEVSELEAYYPCSLKTTRHELKINYDSVGKRIDHLNSYAPHQHPSLFNKCLKRKSWLYQTLRLRTGLVL